MPRSLRTLRDFEDYERQVDNRQEPEDYSPEEEADIMDEKRLYYDEPECDCPVRGFTVWHRQECPLYEE